MCLIALRRAASADAEGSGALNRCQPVTSSIVLISSIGPCACAARGSENLCSCVRRYFTHIKERSDPELLILETDRCLFEDPKFKCGPLHPLRLLGD